METKNLIKNEVIITIKRKLKYQKVQDDKKNNNVWKMVKEYSGAICICQDCPRLNMNL